jgi:ankyrin repeat protein
LIWACIEGKAESARVLLSYHANLNAQNQFGATTLICAAMIGEGSEENDSDEDRARIMEMLLKM